MLASQAGEAGSIPVICLTETRSIVDPMFLVFLILSFFDTDMIPFSRIISVNVTSLSLYSVTIPLS